MVKVSDDQKKVRIHPITGAELVRGNRKREIRHKDRVYEVDLPGWYAVNDSDGANGIHEPGDSAAIDRILVEIRAIEAGLPTPAEVKRIRKGLKLTQRIAGSLIGGGPNAFQKYEAGEVLVSQGVASALRLLDGRPERLAELRSFQLEGQRADS